jgi:hypothetical protein
MVVSDYVVAKSDKRKDAEIAKKKQKSIRTPAVLADCCFASLRFQILWFCYD